MNRKRLLAGSLTCLLIASAFVLALGIGLSIVPNVQAQTTNDIWVTENLIDRNVTSSGIGTTTIVAKISHSVDADNLLPPELELYDSNGSLHDNYSMQENKVIDSTTKQYVYSYNPSDSMSDSKLGLWDVKVIAKDDSGVSSENRENNLFKILDIPLQVSILPNNWRLELAYGFRQKTLGKVQKFIDENIDLENIWINNNQLDKVGLENHLIDSMETAWQGAGGVATDWYTEGGGSWSISVTNYNEATASKDMDLTGIDNLSMDVKMDGSDVGRLKVRVDGDTVFYSGEGTTYGPANITMDVSGYSGESTVTLRINDRGGSGSTGWWDNLVAESSFYNQEKITASPGEIASIDIEAEGNNGKLDGSLSTSYTVNDNRFYHFEIIYEDNFEMFPPNLENRNIYVQFHYKEYETGEYWVENNPENLVVKKDPWFTRIVFEKETDNQYTRTYLPTDYRENIKVIGVAESRYPDLSLYTFQLSQELSEMQRRKWGPPEGTIGIYKYVENVSQYIHHQYWTGTDDAAIWLLFEEGYNMSLKGAETERITYGTVFADTNYTKVVNPVQIGEYEGDKDEVVYKDMTFSAYQDSNDDITVEYEDNSNGSKWVYVKITRESDDKVVYWENNTASPNDFKSTYSDPVENTPFTVFFEVKHSQYDFADTYTASQTVYVGSEPQDVIGDVDEDGVIENALSRLGTIGDGEEIVVGLGTFMAFMFYIVILLAAGPDAAGMGIIMVGIVSIFFVLFGIVSSFGWTMVTIFFLLGVLTIFSNRRGM